MDYVFFIIIAAAWVAVTATNFAKNKWGFGVAALVGSPWSLIGVFRLARPGSWWYRKRYDDRTRLRSDRRYPDGCYWPRYTALVRVETETK